MMGVVRLVSSICRQFLLGLAHLDRRVVARERLPVNCD
jgi:hypothetical protein